MLQGWEVNVRDGVPADLSLVFLSEYPRLVGALHLMVGDLASAEDLAQETFLRALRHWSKVASYDQPALWIRRVGFNLALNAKRDRRRIREVMPEEQGVQPQFNDPEIAHALRALPAQQRAAAILCLVEDRPVAEVARIMACAESTVRVHLHRARKRLCRILGEPEASDVSR